MGVECVLCVCDEGWVLSVWIPSYESSKGEGSMHIVAFEVEGDVLVMRVDLSQELGASSSGKSVIIATTGGNVAVPGREAVKVGLNVYRPRAG
jgi:hypothetical protein